MIGNINALRTGRKTDVRVVSTADQKQRSNEYFSSVQNGTAAREAALLTSIALPAIRRAADDLQRAAELAATGDQNDIEQAAQIYAQHYSLLSGLYYSGILD